MASLRPLLLAASLSLILVACSKSDSQPTPEGPHYHYISNKAFVPTNPNQINEYALDLNGDKSVDNQLGSVLSTLGGMGFNVQQTIDKAVAEGSIILLVDFQTKDFTNTTAAGLQLFLGDLTATTPAPCTGTELYTCTMAMPPVCMGCGHHLQGTGMTAPVANGPENPAVAGKIINGTFNGGPGNLTLQIALGGTTAITLDLMGARAQASGITESGITSAILGGALSQSDLNTKVVPAIATQLGPILDRDCPAPRTPTACNCMDPSTGKTIISMFDGADGTAPDCMITVPELLNAPLIKSLLAPDVKIDGVDALSLGIKVTATKATYTIPGEM